MALLAELRAASQTLDVCVFTITCNEIADALVDAASRGVRVRVITDREQAGNKGSDVTRLRSTPGIQVRTDNDEASHMHHKFAIVDGTTLLNGSFNWTRGAVLSNQENVVVSRRVPFLTSAFAARFEYMWKQFAGNS